MARHSWGVMAGFALDGAPHARKLQRAVEAAERGEGEELDLPVLLDATRFRFMSMPGCLRCGCTFDLERIDDECPKG